MSKGTLGTFLGAGIGFLIGGPAGAQIGALIGGAVGSSFDTIEGRKVGEMASPRAQEGEPIPLTFGSARVTGRLMSCGEPEIRTETEGGKGGPKVENETAYLSYSILICESSELRDSSINGILMVIENNKIVYDVRPNPAISASDSAKWKANKIFYFGGESQGVDPTEQMIHGAGNVPAYRGLCRMVVTDEDVTQHGGSIPTYEFVTSQCGVEEEFVAGARFLGTGVTTGPTASIRPLSYAMAWQEPADIAIAGNDTATLEAVRYGDYMVSLLNNGTNLRLAAISDLTTWSNGPTTSSINRMIVSGSRLIGFRTDSQTIHYLDSPTDAGLTTGPTLTGGLFPIAMAGNGTNVLACDANCKLWGSSNNGSSFTAASSLMGSMETVRNTIDVNGDRFVIAGSTPTSPVLVAYFTDNLGVSTTACTISGAWNTTPYQVLYCGGGHWLIACVAASPGQSSLFHSSNDGASFSPVTLPRNLYFDKDHRQNMAVDAISGRVVIAGEEITTGTIYYYWTDDFITWTEVSRTGTDVSGIAAIYPFGTVTGYTPPDGGIELPDVPGHYYDPATGGPSGPTTTIDDCPPITLDEIIDKLDARAGIPSANSITTELNGIEVPGYAIDQFMTVAEAKEPLRQVYFFDCPEYDDAIRYRLRGQATDFTVDPDDLIVGEDATEKGVRGQTVEFPKRLHVQYVDPATGYKPMKQTAERVSPDIRVKGELVAGANITLDADTAKQAADIGLKTAWTEREDSREIVLPMDYFADAVAAHTFTLDGRRYRITDMRVEAGAIYIESKYDRISAYSSSATGNAGPSPTPGSSLSGPTVSAIMNLPVLRDADDKAGIYWAASGLLATWPGAQLQLSRNGTTFESGPKVTQSATMGTLSASLASASRYGMDNTNTLSVTLTTTSGALDSTDYDGLIAEENAAAILYADGTAEIVQFQTATETAPGEYDLTGLLRGRKDTVVGSHSAGAQFVLLNDKVRFAAIKSSDVGRTLTFRGVSLNTPAASNPSQTIAMTTIQSLREWAPYNVTVESDGAGGYCVNWIGRGRLGNSRSPAHSQWFDGYRVTFTAGDASHVVDTTAQAVCVDYETLSESLGSVFGWPTVTVQARSRVATNDDDFDSDPADPITPQPAAKTQDGRTASTTTGPNGGYADDAPYPIPAPTTLGSNVVSGGDFSAPDDLEGWLAIDGSALPSGWSIVDGKANYYGGALSAAYYFPARYIMPRGQFPRQTVTVTAKVMTGPGTKAAIGIAWGTTTAYERPNQMDVSEFAEYAVETTVTHTYVRPLSPLPLPYQFNYLPVMVASREAAGIENAWFDDVEMEVTEASDPTTSETPTGIDFSSGLTNWTLLPPTNALTPTMATSSGEMSMTPTSVYGIHRHVVCDDPISLADTIGKWVRIRAEVWCNDPTVYSGTTANGISLGIALKTSGVVTSVLSDGLSFRGDWTEIEAWFRVPMDAATLPGTTVHADVSMQCSVGYTCKVRNIQIDVTDSVIT